MRLLVTDNLIVPYERELLVDRTDANGCFSVQTAQSRPTASGPLPPFIWQAEFHRSSVSTKANKVPVRRNSFVCNPQTVARSQVCVFRRVGRTRLLLGVKPVQRDRGLKRLVVVPQRKTLDRDAIELRQIRLVHCLFNGSVNVSCVVEQEQRIVGDA